MLKAPLKWNPDSNEHVHKPVVIGVQHSFARTYQETNHVFVADETSFAVNSHTDEEICKISDGPNWIFNVRFFFFIFYY